MTTKQLDKMFEYNLWANTQLIQLCGTLSDEQLSVEMKGVFGQIHPTLVHLIRAEAGYINRLVGAWVFTDDVVWEETSMHDLLKLAEKSGQKLVEIASQTDPTAIHNVEVNGNPFHFYNWTVVLQALYHGIEHRTQVKMMLTQLGVEHPELAAWDYTASLA
ncbi:MAG: DinB family protein [Chloroflexota bacterium]